MIDVERKPLLGAVCWMCHEMTPVQCVPTDWRDEMNVRCNHCKKLEAAEAERDRYVLRVKVLEERLARIMGVAEGRE